MALIPHPMITRIPVLVLSAAPLFAGELTVESAPFRVEHRFQATVLPVEAPGFELKPETWSSFVIETLADHGAPVKKGEVIIAFEKEAYERRLEDLGRSVTSKEIAVARQQLEVKKLGEEHEIALEAAKRAKETAAEDLEYFKTIGRPAEEAQVEQSLKRARFGVESAEEELKQLKQMYEADDLTEDTEEIILKRQQLSVEMEKFQLSEAQRGAKRTLETVLPRRLEALERAAAEASIAFDKTSQNLPRALEEAKIALKGAEAELEREKLELERLKKDGALLEWKAPVDGICFHGGLDGDTWDYGDLSKYLKVGTAVPVRRTLVTLVPGDAPVRLSARVDAAVADSLKTGEAITLKVPGAGGSDPAGTIGKVEAFPGPDGKLTATLKAEWPEGETPDVGTSVECIRVAYTHPECLAVPEKALVATADGGWSVELKLADGKTESRPVKRGPTDGKRVQIREGLEPGQVVVVPE